MARFKITTPVADWQGESAGVQFAHGRAEVDASTDAGVSALSYFRSAGYGIVPLDGVEVDEAIRRMTTPPADEAAQLKREIAALEEQAGLDELRRRRDELQAKVDKRELAPVGEQGPEMVGGATKLPAPPDSDKVADWRAYAVEHLGVPEVKSKAMNTAELRAEYQRVANAEGGAQ